MRKIYILRIVTVCILCIFFIALMIFFSFAFIKNVDTFKDYRCYDYHLRYLDSGKILGKYSLEYDSYKYDISYRRIKNEDINNFVAACAKWDVVLASPEICVLQNPDTYFSVIDNWTIEKIQFYVVDTNSEPLMTNFYKKDKRQVIYESSESEYINSIKALITQKEFIKFEYSSDFYDEFYEDGNGKKLYMRLVFSDSDNIVWETEICSYAKSSLSERRFSIDVGDKISGYCDKSVKFTEIDKDDVLYSLIWDVVDTIE